MSCYEFPADYPSHYNRKPVRRYYVKDHLNRQDISQRYRDIIEEVLTRQTYLELNDHTFIVDAFMFFAQREFFKKHALNFK